MSTIYWVDFIGKKLLDKKEVDNSELTIPDMPEQSNLDKFSYFSELVGNGVVAVKLQTGLAGVEVPARFKDQELTVNFSHTFNPNDLKYDEAGVYQTLSFQGDLFAVKASWEAVSYVALAAGGQARTWVENMPPEEKTFANKQGIDQESKTEPDPPPRRA